MLLKSITHTAQKASVENLILYILNPKEITSDKGESVIVTRYLTGSSESWKGQFDRVESRRASHYAQKSVKLYHEIIAFHPESSPTKEQIEDLLNKYIALRTDKPTLCFGAVHYSKHTHAHVCWQGIDMLGKSIRRSKADFNKNVQQALEKYQQEKYPELSASFVDYSKPSRTRERLETHPSFERTKRTKEPSQKRQLVALTHEVFVKSHSEEAFVAELAKKDIDCYWRRGVLTGAVFNGRKYRFKHTLGIDFSDLLKQEIQKEERLVYLKSLKEKQDKQKQQER
jgi:hypothetical protein